MPARAKTYLETDTVSYQGQIIPVENLHLNPLGDDQLSRIIVMNGVEFFIQLPPNHNVSPPDGGVLEGDKIKVSKAGTLGFFFKHNGKKVHVRAHVNYFGILQYQGSDAPDEIEVTQGNENSVLSVPEGKFAGIWWSVKKEGKWISLPEIEGIYSSSLTNLIQLARSALGSEDEEVNIRTEFGDGTSNQMPDGSAGGTSFDYIKLIQSTPQQVTITATANPSQGGSVSGGGTFNHGSQVTVSASPTSGWRFVKWTEGGSVVSTSDSYQFTITKNRNLVAVFEQKDIAPTITTASLPEGKEGENYSFQLSAGGTAPITWAIVSGNLPAGLNLSPEGLLSGTPNQNGTFTFTVKASNEAGNSQKQFSLVIKKKTLAPTITTASLPDGKEGEQYSFQLKAEGTAPITWAIVSGNLPAGISLSNEGHLSGTPNQNGTFTFMVKASNQAGEDQKQLALVVKKDVSTTSVEAPSLTITPEEIILEGETLFLYSVRGTLLRSGETHINRSGLSGVFLLTTKKRTMKIAL